MNDLSRAIDAIHSHTAIFTCDEVIDQMLDEVGWPSTQGRLLDPGAGHGDVLLRAIARLEAPLNDTTYILQRLEGWEFHPEAARISRERIAAALQGKGWTRTSAYQAAQGIILERDFLLQGPALKTYEMIVGNPPYANRARIPAVYRDIMDQVVPDYTRHDMLYPYLDACSRHLAPRGRMALVTSDRWLINETTARLRAHLGNRLTFERIERLGTANPFYVPKTRRRNSPPRVHPVIVVARNEAGHGLQMGPRPVILSDQDQSIEGQTLDDHVTIMVAPWMGADGIFVVRRKDVNIPDEHLIPCVTSKDIHPTEDRFLPNTSAVIVTQKELPSEEVMRHLEKELPRMAPRGIRTPKWLPPTSFAHKLPLKSPGLLIPRIAKRLRPILLPAGIMPVNSNIVIADCEDPVLLAEWLNEPEQQQWIARNAPPLEGGYLSITTKLLRRLPARNMPDIRKKKAA